VWNTSVLSNRHLQWDRFTLTKFQAERDGDWTWLPEECDLVPVDGMGREQLGMGVQPSDLDNPAIWCAGWKEWYRKQVTNQPQVMEF
jgi:hypothetical protein